MKDLSKKHIGRTVRAEAPIRQEKACDMLGPE